MDWQGALRTRLIAAPSIDAIVAQRVYWVDRPQEAELPAITLQLVSQSRPQHMGGFSVFAASIVQIDVWGNSHKQVSEIVEAAIAALIPADTSNGVRFTRAFVSQIRDLGERTEAGFIHRSSLELSLHHTTA